MQGQASWLTLFIARANKERNVRTGEGKLLIALDHRKLLA